MSSLKYRPYNIDIEYEYRTYKNIGKDYGNAKNADKGLAFNFIRFIRKWRNREQTEYRTCNTYSDWEKHIYNIASLHRGNYVDMLHWFISQHAHAKIYAECVKVILIPIYIALFTIYDRFLGETLNFWSLMILILILTVFSTCILHDALQKENFYKDLIQIMEGIEY